VPYAQLPVIVAMSCHLYRFHDTLLRTNFWHVQLWAACCSATRKNWRSRFTTERNENSITQRRLLQQSRAIALLPMKCNLWSASP
jgi:hypothetical protein